MNTEFLRRSRGLFILACDVALIVLIFRLVSEIRLPQAPAINSHALWLITATFCFVLLIGGTYSRRHISNSPAMPIRTFLVCIVAGLICVLWVYLLGPQEFKNYFGRGVLLASTCLIGVGTTLVRMVLNRVYLSHEEKVRLLYVGYSKSTEAFLFELKQRAEVRTVTIVADGVKDLVSHDLVTYSSLSILDHLQEKWSAVIIDPRAQLNQQTKKELVSQRTMGVPIFSLAEYYEKVWYIVPVTHIDDEWFFSTQGFSLLANQVSMRTKQVVDVFSAATILVLTLPLLILLGLFIRLDSSGPVVFKQTRVGKGGEHFQLFKFRSMIEGAEPTGPQWAQSNDSRVTRIGRLMRKTRIDEIPQCWNILRGEMSLIGPRPERPEFTSKLSQQIPYYELRHLVKPGITGWAQTTYPYGASVDDALKKLEYDLYYIKHRSILLDLNILLRTMVIVVGGSGR